MDVVNSDYAPYQRAVAALISTPTQLPRLPAITLDIRHALDRRDNSIAAISAVISRDADLSRLLLRYAASVMMHSYMPPQTIFDVVRILGMGQVERIIMLYAVKSMFSGNTQAYTRMFAVAWDSLINKASISALIAKKTHEVSSDYALLGTLLSEVGTLAVLNAFKTGEQKVPSPDIYAALCREFSQNLGVILLKQWQMDDNYIQLTHQIGNWYAAENEPFDLIDVVNLSAYHYRKSHHMGHRLPPITQLTAYRKLSEKYNAITDTNELELVISHRDQIRTIADSLY